MGTVKLAPLCGVHVCAVAMATGIRKGNVLADLLKVGHAVFGLVIQRSTPGELLGTFSHLEELTGQENARVDSNDDKGLAFISYHACFELGVRVSVSFP